MMDLLGLTAKIATMIAEVEIAKKTALASAVRITTEAAKDRIGDYHGDVGPVPAWAPLAPSTVITRESLGFTPDDPLLRTGELRDSIVGGVEGDTGFVGSPLEKAKYADQGTPTQPPRSFLAGGFYDKEAEIRKYIGDAAISIVRK